MLHLETQERTQQPKSAEGRGGGAEAGGCGKAKETQCTKEGAKQSTAKGGKVPADELLRVPRTIKGRKKFPHLLPFSSLPFTGRERERERGEEIID